MPPTANVTSAPAAAGRLAGPVHLLGREVDPDEVVDARLGEEDREPAGAAPDLHHRVAGPHPARDAARVPIAEEVLHAGRLHPAPAVLDLGVLRPPGSLRALQEVRGRGVAVHGERVPRGDHGTATTSASTAAMSAGHRRLGEPVGPGAGGRAERGPVGGVPEVAQHRRRRGPVVARVDEVARLPLDHHDLAGAALVRGDDRLAERHGLDDHEVERRAPRGVHHDVERVEPRPRVALVADQVGAVAEPELADQPVEALLELGVARASDDHEAGVGVLGGHRGGRPEEHVLALPRLEPPDDPDEGRVADAELGADPGAVARVAADGLDVDALVHLVHRRARRQLALAGDGEVAVHDDRRRRHASRQAVHPGVGHRGPAEVAVRDDLLPEHRREPQAAGGQPAVEVAGRHVVEHQVGTGAPGGAADGGDRCGRLGAARGSARWAPP